jgi:hypothetical protein
MQERREETSELEAQAERSRLRAKQLLKNLIENRAKVKEKLGSSEISEKERMDLESSYEQFGNMIQKLRYSGILDA